MRYKILLLALLIGVQSGCATGARVGGNEYGVGVGGYIGAVPESIQQERSYSAPLPAELALPKAID